MKNQDRAKILLVDDDLDLLESARLLLRGSFEIFSASSVHAAKAVARNNNIDVAVVDLNFEGQEEDGLHFIDWATSTLPNLAILVLSGDSSTRRVVEATRRSLVDFIPKSGNYERDLKVAINKGLALRDRNETSSSFTFQTRSPAVKRVLDTIDRIAKSGSDCSVLITGETGAGKEILAKHFAARVRKKLVAANMASIPREMAESQLFGHTKGSFTGAHADKPGLITQSHRGIFFLDELGECSTAVQAKLLRVLQDKEVQPLGGHPTKIDVQFLAATNQNLDAMVSRGEFRLDLLQRLNAMVLQLPSLRERPEDIEFYTMLFLNEFAADNSFVIRASGLDALLSHVWRGNTRELYNVIQKIVILSNKRELDGDVVVSALGHHESGVPVRLENTSIISKYQGLRAKILATLEQTHGNRTKAAEALAMHPTTLFRWIKKLGIGQAIASKPGRPMIYEGNTL